MEFNKLHGMNDIKCIHNVRQNSGRYGDDFEDHIHMEQPTITETVRLNRLRWFGHLQRIEGNRIPPQYYV
jgi:hypothetical protein